MRVNQTLSNSQVAVLATNSVVRNTYILLSMTLLFSAGAAFIAMATNAKPLGLLVSIIGMFGLLFLTQFLRNSIWGLVSTFAFTGFMGYMLGPILNQYISSFSNGSQLVMTALGATGIIFLALSAYAFITRKDFSYMGGFLFAAISVAFLVGIGAAIFNWPLGQLLVSGAFAILSSGLILFQTSQIIHGGERNYIMATITLYVSLFNLFTSLLNLLAAFAGNRE